MDNSLVAVFGSTGFDAALDSAVRDGRALAPCSRCRQELPEIGKDAVRESEGLGQLDLLFERITDRAETQHGLAVDPAFQPGRKHRRNHWVIGSMYQALRLTP